MSCLVDFCTILAKAEDVIAEEGVANPAGVPGKASLLDTFFRSIFIRHKFIQF